MTETEQSVQARIVLLVGDVNGVLSQNIVALWNGRADKALIAPKLRELYTMRDAIDAVLGTPGVASAVSFSMSGDISQRLGERRLTYSQRRKDCQDEIDLVECRAQAISAPVIEQLVNVEPEIPPTEPPPVELVPNANDSVYKGDPYVTSGGGLIAW